MNAVLLLFCSRSTARVPRIPTRSMWHQLKHTK